MESMAVRNQELLVQSGYPILYRMRATVCVVSEVLQNLFKNSRFDAAIPLGHMSQRRAPFDKFSWTVLSTIGIFAVDVKIIIFAFLCIPLDQHSELIVDFH